MSVSADYTNKGIFLDGQKGYHSDQLEKEEDVLGKDAFLTMMVAQLKNQDPLNPMEGTDFTAQLAQFSSLEQQITTNSNLDAILNELKSTSDESSLFNYIGKNVTSDGNPVTVENGQIISGGQFTLDEASGIDVVVYNSHGVAIRVLSSGSEFIEAGSYDIEWDGRDETGFKVANGEYTYDIIARNGDGEYINADTSTSGIVTGLSTKNGKAYLVVNDRLVDVTSVETVSLPDEGTNQ